MSWRGQEGMTLVELLVAMAVTSFVLLGISSALVVGIHAAQLWGQKISEAQTVNQLPGWLDQDLHRYVPCSGSGAGELDLCLPAASSPSVRYTTTSAGGGCPCTIRRSDVSTGTQWVVARDLARLPSFQQSCGATAGSGVDVGWVQVSNLVYRPSSQAPPPAYGPPPLVLYFRAPRGSC